jgi:glucuronate isomerase
METMRPFIHDHFLLESKVAEELYHQYTVHPAIIDYHSHLSPQIVCENKNFDNICHIWLQGDHYKWRAMRAFGVDEHFITGKASDKEKFLKWSEVVPYTLRNPLFHWTQMELKNPFGIHELLNPETAESIFHRTNECLATEDFKPQALLKHFKVEVLGTTDDPIDTLEYHLELQKSEQYTKVLPSFRPDKVFKINTGQAFRQYIQALEAASNTEIRSLASLMAALQNRVDFFDQAGCVTADHGLNYLPFQGKISEEKIDQVFREVLAGKDEHAEEITEAYTFRVLKELCMMYHEKNWVQQFHLGALRDANFYRSGVLGADTGFDTIGDYNHAERIGQFLSSLEQEGKLAKTILYNLNPADNHVFAAMAGNFQAEGVKGKIQFGSAWWFLDQLDGMTQQLNTLSNLGLISTFIGMLTDSRSFLSYSRHEYFRRLLCNLFAQDIHKGYIPNDLKWIGGIIEDICYRNAKSYFNL